MTAKRAAAYAALICIVLIVILCLFQMFTSNDPAASFMSFLPAIIIFPVLSYFMLISISEMISRGKRTKDNNPGEGANDKDL